MAIQDYLEYERRIALDHLVPWLRTQGALPASGAAVLDVGCGYGGTLAALKEACPRINATGLDLDAAMTREGNARLAGAAELVHANFFDWEGGPYDLILMRDVLEHIRRPEEALLRAASMLNPGGWIFVSFAPFFGPFGGHQHNGEGALSHVPWLQVLPAAAFRRVLRVEGNTYKSEPALQEDMESVLETRLTMGRFVRGAQDAGLHVAARASYLSRPDYRIKFGLPEVRLPQLRGLEETLATGIEALLQRGA